MRDITEGMTVDAEVVARLSWDYSRGDSRLRTLYEKGQRAQWSVDEDIDWSPELRFGSPLPDSVDGTGLPFRRSPDSPVPAELWNQFRWEFQSWMTSQFLHGEQGALTATARLVETVPDLEAKFYAAVQVADEARHVDAYARYLTKLGSCYPINGGLRALLENIMSESRWDMIYLGMQIIVEGLALAAFRLGNASFADPVILQITKLVARDEARHVAFGMVALDGYYDELTSRELAEREEFTKEATLLMSRRFLLTEVWDRLEVDTAAGTAFAAEDPLMLQFRRLLFAKVVSSLQRLGLCTPGVRDHLDQLALLRRPGT
ncbi:ferritin-like domain-containing protein [Streptomyces chartreusis]|uniref:ferritin-like domain-containing protein n=1 Tax=Streptomyces chartreusis TaxID=1969 RepID=UPI0033A8CEF4